MALSGFCLVEESGSKAISSTTRPETELGPRPTKAGLGVQESGVSGGRRVAGNTSLPLSKGDDWHCRNVRPSVILAGMTMKSSVRIEMTLMKPSQRKLVMHTHQLSQSVITRYRSRI